MKLVLAEKPSVAQSIAKVLGAAKREDGYLEGNGYVVSWCVGHLVELAQPEVYDAKYSKWAYADLPIFPMDWQYEVSAGTKKQFGILKKLMAREDVASLVCATDAGREGELIFRLVYHKAGCRKPFERLWISSMEDVAIKEGFENLRSGTEYDALYEAALCRERADWIVGINAIWLPPTITLKTASMINWTTTLWKKRKKLPRAMWTEPWRMTDSSTMVLPFTISRSISASVSMGTTLTKRHTHRSEPVRNPNSRNRNTSSIIFMLPRTFRSGVRWTSRNTVPLMMPCEPTMHFLTRREKPWVQ